MEFLTNEKLTIVGAAGMIGSNMAQTAAMLKLTPNICLYDVYEPGLEGVTEEMRHCGFEGVSEEFTQFGEQAGTERWVGGRGFQRRVCSRIGAIVRQGVACF